MGKSERDENLGAWVGSRAELQKLLDLISRIIHDAADSKLEELKHFDSTQISRINEWIRKDEEWLAVHSDDQDADLVGRDHRRQSLITQRKMLQEHQSSMGSMSHQFEDDWSTKLEVIDRRGTDSETRYDSSELAQIVNPRTVKTISIQAPVGYGSGARPYDIRIFGDSSGLRLSVSSPSVAFTNAAIGQIRDELKKGRPWWFWMNFVSLLVLGGIVFSMAFYLLISPAPTPFSLVNFVAALVGGYGFSSMLAYWFTRNFPPLVVLDDGGRSRGGPAVLWLFTLVASVPIGLLVNFISAT